MLLRRFCSAWMWDWRFFSSPPPRESSPAPPGGESSSSSRSRSSTRLFLDALAPEDGGEMDDVGEFPRMLIDEGGMLTVGMLIAEAPGPVVPSHCRFSSKSRQFIEGKMKKEKKIVVPEGIRDPFTCTGVADREDDDGFFWLFVWCFFFLHQYDGRILILLRARRGWRSRPRPSRAQSLLLRLPSQCRRP